MTAPSFATIARVGWVGAAEIPLAGLSLSWRTDGAGLLTGIADAKELSRYGFSPTARNGLKGKWLWYEHPTAGGWAGTITGSETQGAFTTITAEDFATNLRKRRLGSNWRPFPSSPGAIVLQFLTSAERAGENLGLTGWVAEEGGDTITWDPRAGDLYEELIPELADFGYQWHVISRTKDERLFEFRRRLGTDKRRSVLLSDGRHIIAESADITGDLWTVANSIEGIAADSDYNHARGYQQDSQASIRALGRRFEEQIAYDGVATRSTIAPLVKKDLAKFSYPQELITVDIMDADDCWRLFREGDTVSIALAAAGIQCPMQIDVRSLDVDTATVTISGALLVSET